MKYQINGKLEDDIKKLNGIQDIIGIKAKNIFASASIEELDEKMADMNLVDLQKLAVSCGISGGGTRTVLKTKIRNEFLKFLKGSHGLSLSSQEKMALKGDDKTERERKIHNLMMEGL